MERFNPFANSSTIDDPDPFTTSFNRSSQTAVARTDSSGSASRVRFETDQTPASPQRNSSQLAGQTSRYSTNFPDPFADSTKDIAQPTEVLASGLDIADASSTTNVSGNSAANRSNSVTFAPTSHSVDSVDSTGRGIGRQGSGFSSFLSRATSVTSSSVTDRVSGAVGSVRSAVDSISSQIQQAVPSNLNERLSSTATNLIGASNSGDQLEKAQQQQQAPQPSQSAASYLASKISSATGQFASSTGQSSSSLTVINRQRVILIIDSLANTDWAQEFNNYHKLMSSGSGSASQSALTSFFSSATAQLTSSSSNSINNEGVDLIEQADFRDISVLANQITSTATIYVTNTNNSNNNRSSNAKSSARIIRPEYVVIKQRTRDNLNYLRSIVNGLNYCLVPMFQPIEIWNIFQDRQLAFSKLLRVQKILGKEFFPLIPQVYCQTHQDLLNYINSSTITLPCLVRTGPLGKGKIKIETLQMLKDFSSIMATSRLSCTLEPYLMIKYDLIVQKMGTSLKLFKRNASKSAENGGSGLSDGLSDSLQDNLIKQDQQFSRQSATRQTSLGSSVLSSLIGPTSSLQQQFARKNSVISAYEKLSEVNARYRNWIEAITREFDNKIDAFYIKIAVATNDREYIVGLADCTMMDFMGNQENQDEDRRSFVELIISNMNTVLPKNHQLSREPSYSANISSTTNKVCLFHQGSNDDPLIADSTIGLKSVQSSTNLKHSIESPIQRDKKKYTSQTQISGTGKSEATGTRNYGQLSSRSQSVSVNQFDQDPLNKSSYFVRRGSDQSDSLTTGLDESSSIRGSQNLDGSSGGLHQRQSSLGQSIFDQTSTALSSFQKQFPLSFFKRLETRAGDISSTPPQSAKSDKVFDRAFMDRSSDGVPAVGSRNGFKSQSMDSSTLESPKSFSKRGVKPPKPPPPQSMSYRQSSLASYSSQKGDASKSADTPNSSPAQTRQNSYRVSDSIEGAQRTKVVRQNSALSAFEPFEPDEITRTKETLTKESSGSAARQMVEKPKRSVDFAKSTNSDSSSITSGDSNSTGEITTADDTMNNLKKTFASIFGDKCE